MTRVEGQAVRFFSIHDSLTPESIYSNSEAHHCQLLPGGILTNVHLAVTLTLSLGVRTQSLWAAAKLNVRNLSILSVSASLLAAFLGQSRSLEVFKTDAGVPLPETLPALFSSSPFHFRPLLPDSPLPGCPGKPCNSVQSQDTGSTAACVYLTRHLSARR